MKVILITGVLTFFLALNLSGQQILKKKDIQSRLDQISLEINQNNFEEALNLFFNKEEIILEENIPKKELARFQKISETLSEKKNVFDYNQKVVIDFKALVDDNEFCKSIKLLDLKLTESNSYNSTRDTYNTLISIANEAKTKCEQNSKDINTWTKLYSDQEFERLYNLLGFSSIDKKYFFGEDLIKLNEIISNLLPKYEIYKVVKENIITKPDRIINSIDYTTLSYEQAVIRKRELENLEENSKVEIEKILGENPVLLNEYAKAKQFLSSGISRLNKFINLNRPLSSPEVTEIAFSSNPISLEFIENRCLKAHKNIYSIYDLNVFSFYNLRDYDTDLQKEIFKNTAEYKGYLSELKEMRNNLIKTTYFQEAKGLFNSVDYDVKKRGFDLIINQNWGVTGTFGAIPPKSISIDVSNTIIQLKSLPTREVVDDVFGGGIKNEILFIQLEPEIGLEIEKNRNDISVYYLFIPNGKETVKFKYYTDGWWDITNDFITSSKVKVIVANKISGKIYFNKTY